MWGSTVIVLALAAFTHGQKDLIFDGGSISSFHVRQVNQTFMRMHLMVVTGWQLGSGACEGKCTMKEINTVNANTGDQGTKDIYLGKWTAEAGYANNFQTMDITNYVQHNSISYVIGINKIEGWELLVTEFDYDIDMKADYTDITLSGPKWRPYHRDGTVASPEMDLQIKLKPQIRNDTGLPNGSPVTVFKPVYRIPLNQVSIINLAPVDPDGDAVICEPAAFVSAGGIRSPANITIHKDCRVEVAAYENLGYADDGLEAVAVVMSDYNRHPITMGDAKVLKPYFRYLSQISIQLMVHTVKTVTGPKLIAPTPDDLHNFVVEVNTLLNISLAAQGDSPIKSFHVSSVPYANVTLTQGANGDAVLQWRPTNKDLGTYVILLRATDDNGMTTPERSFVVKVKDREPFTLLPHPNDPEFTFVPSVEVFHCEQGDTCFIAVPLIASYQVGSIEGVGNTDLLSWHGPYTSAPGTGRYQADILVDGMTPGMHQQCLKLTSDTGTSEHTLCVNVSVTYKDPCAQIPCMHFGECTSDKSTFTCKCLSTYTGDRCEKVSDACSPSPCVHGKCYNLFSGPTNFYCKCDAGFTGTKCDAAGSGVTNGVLTTIASLITDMLTTGGSVGGTCADKPGVNCTLLDRSTTICDSPIGTKYCSSYCHMCDVSTASG